MAVLVVGTAAAPGQRPPAYATHDWSVTGAADSLHEAWADVKTPGDGKSYQVGTIEVRTTRSVDNPQFSGASIERGPSSLPEFVGDPLPGGLPATFTGLTTPACALSPFGIRVVGPTTGVVYPDLPRMLIDYQGSQPGSGVLLDGAILVSRPRPEQTYNLLGMVLQFDLPNTTPPVVLLPEGVELWVTASSAALLLGTGVPHHAVRVPLSGGIPVGTPVLAQLLVAMSAPFGVPAGCVGNGWMAASPGLWFQN